MTKIGIIGGGIGGLCLAYFLEKKLKNPNITIFEANDRLGGRILTRKFDSVPIKYNAGAAEFYSIVNSPGLDTLIRELKLLKVDMWGFPTIVLNRENIIADNNDFYKIFKPETIKKIDSFIKLGKRLRTTEDFGMGGNSKDNKHPWFNRTFDDILNDIGDEEAKKFIAMKAHCDLATEPPKTNGVFGFDNILIDDLEYIRMYSLKDGNDTLIKRIYSKIKSAKIYINSPVYTVNKFKNKYRLTVRMNKKTTINHDFDIVVLAVAHPQIKKIDFTEQNLKQKITDFYNYYNYDTHYLRITCLFKNTFWRKLIDESYFIIDNFGGCCVYDQTEWQEDDPDKMPEEGRKNYGILSWLISGENALELNALPDDKLIEKALASLPKKIEADGRKNFLEGKVDRWIDMVSRQPGGKPIKDMTERHYPDKKGNPNFMIIGDYLIDTTINGSVWSAEVVTKEIINSLK